MIRILTFFLDLSTGIQPVDLQIANAVTRVEIRLDGEPVTVLEAPPWSFDLDLDEELVPHRLTAIAFDARGRELDRVHRLINIADAAYGPPPDSDGLDVSSSQEFTAVAVELEGRRQLPSTRDMAGWFLARGEPVQVLAVEEGPAEVVVVRDPAAQTWMEVLAEFFFAQENGGRIPEDFDVNTLGLDQEGFSKVAKEHFHDTVSLLQMHTLWDSWNRFMQIEGETALRFLSPLAAPASTRWNGASWDKWQKWKSSSMAKPRSSSTAPRGPTTATLARRSHRTS